MGLAKLDIVMSQLTLQGLLSRLLAMIGGRVEQRRSVRIQAVRRTLVVARLAEPMADSARLTLIHGGHARDPALAVPVRSRTGPLA